MIFGKGKIFFFRKKLKGTYYILIFCGQGKKKNERTIDPCDNILTDET